MTESRLERYLTRHPRLSDLAFSVGLALSLVGPTILGNGTGYPGP